MNGLNKDDIIRMAREAGYIGFQFTSITTLEAFAHLVAEAEREACAKACESAGPGAGPIYCAFAIRARGKNAA